MVTEYIFVKINISFEIKFDLSFIALLTFCNCLFLSEEIITAHWAFLIVGLYLMNLFLIMLHILRDTVNVIKMFALHCYIYHVLKAYNASLLLLDFFL